MKPLVSIVTPIYNAEKYIEECVKSVKNQSYSNFEMILVDDYSKDQSVAKIKKLILNDTRFTLVAFEQNQGAASARNRAIELAKGKYIAFLDSDDLWHSNKLEKQIQFMEENKVAFSFSSYEVINEEGDHLSNFIIPKKELNYNDLLKTCSIGCLTAIYNCEQLGKHFMKPLRKRQDYTLWLELLKITNAVGLKEVLAKYRVSNTSLSGNKFSAAKFQWHVYRQIENLSLLKSIYYFIHYSINGLMKYK